MYEAFAIFGQASKTKVNIALASGHGPLLNPKWLEDNTFGTFFPGVNSKTINLSKNHLLKFEEGKIGGEAIDATALHELTHYFDDQDKMNYPSEAGDAFEIYCYGEVLYD